MSSIKDLLEDSREKLINKYLDTFEVDEKGIQSLEYRREIYKAMLDYKNASIQNFLAIAVLILTVILTALTYSQYYILFKQSNIPQLAQSPLKSSFILGLSSGFFVSSTFLFGFLTYKIFNKLFERQRKKWSKKRNE